MVPVMRWVVCFSLLSLCGAFIRSTATCKTYVAAAKSGLGRTSLVLQAGQDELEGLKIDGGQYMSAEVLPAPSLPTGMGPQSEGTLFVLLAALAMAISYADRSNLSTAIIPMAKELGWDNLFSGFVLSSFWAGYATTQVLGGVLADGFGGELLLILAMVLWSIATALTPAAAAAGTVQVISARVLLGAGEGLALPAIHSMITKYVGTAKKSFAAAAVTSACYLGALLSNFLAPKIIDQYDWQTCFYGFAAIPSLVWIPLWLAFLYSKKKSGKLDSKKGLTSAEQDVGESTADAREGILSVVELLKSRPVWAIIAAQYGQSWGMIGLLSWLPTYYTQRFNVPLSSLADFTVLPYVLQLVVSLAAGSLADGLIAKGVRTLSVRKVLQTVGMLVPAVCLGICSYATDLSAIQAAQLITLGSAVSAVTVGAVSCNHFDISRKNTGAIFGIGNTASCIGGLIAVPSSGYLYDLTNSWSVVFALFSLHYVLGCVLFNLWAEDKVLETETFTVI